jgi:hypothetical protein
MAGLAIRSEARELNPALANIGELKNVIFHSVLREGGFSDVVNTPGEVAGNKNSCRISIIHLHIADRNFWRVAACVCDAGFGEASAMVDEVSTAIDRLAFL